MLNLVINFTPTGMIPTKAMTPHIPVAVEEIVSEVLGAVEIGITMVHLHARDEDTEAPTYIPEVYERIIAGIRKYAPDLIICVSLSGRNFNKLEQRSAVLKLQGNTKPDMGSLTLSSLNFNTQASVNSPDMIKALAQEMKERDIVPELEVFDAGMINYAKYLEHKGLIQAPHYFNLILGNIACAQPDILHLGVLLRDLPEDSIWSVGAVGDSQLMMNSVGIAIGGGVRVGLEDNIWYDIKRTHLAQNSDLLKRIHALAEVNERGIMRPKELRELLKLKNGHGNYGRIWS